MGTLAARFAKRTSGRPIGFLNETRTLRTQIRPGCEPGLIATYGERLFACCPAWRLAHDGEVNAFARPLPGALEAIDRQRITPVRQHRIGYDAELMIAGLVH